MFSQFGSAGTKYLCGLAVALFLICAPTFAQELEVNEVDTGTKVEVFVPRGFPLAIEGATLARTIDGALMLKVRATSETAIRIKALEFFITVVDANGLARGGRNWTTKRGLQSLQTANFETAIGFDVQNGDRILLAPYELKGHKKNLYAIAPLAVVDHFKAAGLLKTRTAPPAAAR